MTLPCRYYVTFILAVVEMIFFGGIVYGWASLVYILKEEHYFSDSCVFNETSASLETDVCEKQDAKLNLVFTIASAVSLMVLLPTGLIFDWLGTRFTRILTHFIYVTGLLLVLISSPETPILLFPGMTFIAVGGASQFITLVQTGNLFEKNRSTVITVISGSYDGSAIVMLLIKFAYEAGVSLSTSFAFQIGGTVIFFVMTFYLLPNGKIPWPLPPYYKSSRRHKLEKVNESMEKDLSLDLKILDEDQKYAEKCLNDDFPTLISCLTSPSCLLLCFWFSLLQLRMHTYLGSFNPLFVELTGGSQELVDHYTKVFSFIQFGGVFTAPFAGMILDRNKGKPNRQPYDDLEDSALGFAITSLLLVVFSIITTIPIHQVQYAGFVVQVVARSFVYALMFAAVALMFPLRFYGRIAGVVAAIGAAIDFLQYPLYRMTQRFFNNDFLMMNIILLVSCAATIALPIYAVYHAKRMNKEKRI